MAHNLDSYGQPTSVEDIAVIGMACRLPGVSNPDEFWQLLIENRSTIRDLSLEELMTNNIPEHDFKSASYVKRGSVLEDSYCFDANFFGYSVKEAENMDPQQRQFLECAWEALECSGIVPAKYSGDIGVFACQGKNNYYISNFDTNHSYSNGVNDYQTILGNEKDFLSTKVSYKLNLTGPSINVQTGCSSSLVAVQMACESLQNANCDIALAGGVSLSYQLGYHYQEGMILSPDGYCRAFDINANGTVVASGVGIVVLKRLSDAKKDKDSIYAVIKGGALNNDGSSKIAYSAPSITGQACVIKKALKNADVGPESINYIEAHGTGTLLGDPIEWAALHSVYEQAVTKKEACYIGSVKTNIGHTDTAAGVFGLIKTVLSLKNKIIPATLNFTRLNSEISSFNTVFKVADNTLEWQKSTEVRRAAVSSFGVGGTNAHVVLEEYVEDEESKSNSLSDNSGYFLIPFSAVSSKTLHRKSEVLRHYLEYNKDQSVENIAFTSQEGRIEFKHRGFFVVQRADLNNNATTIIDENISKNLTDNAPSCVFVCSDLQQIDLTQYRVLYQKYTKFKELYKECADIAFKLHGINIEMIFEQNFQPSLNAVFYRLAVFSAQYALSQLLIITGAAPSEIVAYGDGSLLAATILGVLTLENALKLVFQIDDFKSLLRQMELSEPKYPIGVICSLTGRLITKQKLSTREYWLSSMRNQETSFNDINGFDKSVPFIFVSSASLIYGKNILVHQKGVPTLSNSNNVELNFLNLIGQLWNQGLPINWSQIRLQNSRKVSMPTNPFEKQIFRINTTRSYKSTSEYSNASMDMKHSTANQLKIIWSNVLGISPEAITDSTNFIQEGGDSMAALDLLSQIKKVMNVEFDFDEFSNVYDFNEMLSLIENSTCN